MEQIARTRIYKKTSSDFVLTLYLSSRDLVSKNGIVEPLKGVIYINPNFLDQQYKIYGQLTLMFRYGREDEEVMGLKFCSETVIAIKQILPIINTEKTDIDDDDDNEITPVQTALVERLGPGAYPFSLEIGKLAPPSIQLIPAKKYNGQPIGTSYEIRLFMVDINDEKLQPRTQVRLGVRLLHKIPSDLIILEHTIPTYTSLPKSIKSRLSPKHLRLHCQKNQKQNSKSITSIDVPSTNLTENKIKTENELKCLNKIENNLLNKNNNRFHKQHSYNSYNNNNNYNSNPDEIIICSGGTIRLPNAPTTIANISTHPLILDSYEKNRNIKINNSSITDFNNIILNRQVITLGNRTSEDNNSTVMKGPMGYINKPFLFAEGKVILKASLNKSVYEHGETVSVTIDINNNSKKIIKKIKIYAVQHIDVCMFSDGKFKNIVADINEIYQIKPNECYNKTYDLIPQKGLTKNWIAIEGSYFQGGSIGETSSCDTLYKIASSAHRGPTTITGNSRNQHLFAAIYVSYYVKIKLILSGMGGEISLKLPFIIGYIDNNIDSDIIISSDDDENEFNKNNNIDDEYNNKKLVNNKLIDINDKNIKLQQQQQPNKLLNNLYNIDNDIILDDNNKLIKKFNNIKLINDNDKKNLYEQQETISLHSENNDEENQLNNDDENKLNINNIIKLKNNNDENNDKYLKEKNLLKMLKLKRTNYSKSCEGMDTFCR